MNTTKTVYNRLFSKKTELESHKIELGLIQDIEAEMAQANKGAMTAIDLAEKAKTPAEKSLKLNKDLLKKIEKTKKAAIELGSNEVLKKVQNIEKQVKDNIQSIDKLITALYKI